MLRRLAHKRKYMSTKKLYRSYGGDTVIVVFLVVLGFFIMIPFFYALFQSFKPPEELWNFPPNFIVRNPTLRNYRNLLREMSYSWVPFSRYVFNSIFITVVGTLGQIVLSSMCAYALAKHRFYGSKTIFRIIVMSLMFTANVTAIPNFLVISRLRLMDSPLAIILPAFSKSLGLYLMKQFIETMVPDSVIESARMEGASEWRVFWFMVMPMVKPAWLTLVIFSVNELWSGQSIFLQSEQKKTFASAISSISGGGIAMAGVSSATVIVMMLVPIIVYIVSQSNVVKTMSTSGMKE